MGGFFGITSKKECLEDVFFGVDYHSHLGTRRGGLAAYDAVKGLQREIHNIENSPFRTKFEKVFEEMHGTSAVGVISDTDPEPLLIRSSFGSYAICFVGVINNADKLIEDYLNKNKGHFDAMTSGKVNSVELVASLINLKESIEEGITYVQDVVDGTVSLLILQEDGALIAARDKIGILPIQVAKNDDGYAVSFESYPFFKLGYEKCMELGPGQVIRITPDGIEELVPAGEKMKICSFLWSYYGYPTSSYEGVNVEEMRYKNGEIMAENDRKNGFDNHIDAVSAVPDSGIPHAIGYARGSSNHYCRALIKYTPTWARSFMPTVQSARDRIAKMKQIPIKELVEGRDMLFVDDSIVRGTQIRETVEQLYQLGVRSIHMRSACPPIMYKCKYLNFSNEKSEMELIARKAIMALEGEEGLKYISEYADGSTERGKNLRDFISEHFNFSSLEFQTLDGIVKAIGLPKCKLCTYCWDGEE